ncbi:MAG: threonine--tRNA ligase [Candidatus Berkelbacteria bacterium]|nr:MAG: threonine--tRNA ligase [Candidatus Berkelbacteria bacterium]QQG51974.1 MAG: threonine--tRNA ligase [Candidatus Berkelbacteria bacterium]
MKSQKPYEDSRLYRIRHTAAHLLAMAVLEYDPKAKLAIGPPIEHGFYYDFEFTKPINDEVLRNLEKTIGQLIAKNLPVEHKTLTRSEALGRAKKEHQPYKEELINDLPDKELSHYVIGDFWDLCKGPHVASTGEVKAVKLLGIAGAYWRGSENNPMLTRIYGTAFESKKELDEHLKMLEEAKKRDHKKLGVALDLFVFSPLVGPGLPLWTPKGTVIRELLDDFVWELRRKKGYEKVEIPHLAKKDLYEKSGHWDKFKDDLFVIETREGKQFAVKPMNCPHHTQIFARKKWSYREMPQRYANTTMVYRDEQSGELAGLSRVISITQDDAHVFCRPDQVSEELDAIWDIVEEFYSRFGFRLEVRLSFHDPKTPEKYLGDPKIWKNSEAELEKTAKKRGAKYLVAPGEANFYGPKIDFMAYDSLERQWQVATIQLDMNLPKRFELTFVNPAGKDEDVVMIHAAIMGSIERFVSILIEHFGGEFPVWLAPVQVVVLPLSEKFVTYADKVSDELHQSGVRVETDDSNESLGKRIRQAEGQKIPFILVVGEKEQTAKTVAVRERHTPEQSTVSVEQFLSLLRGKK